MLEERDPKPSPISKIEARAAMSGGFSADAERFEFFQTVSDAKAASDRRLEVSIRSKIAKRSAMSIHQASVDDFEDNLHVNRLCMQSRPGWKPTKQETDLQEARMRHEIEKNTTELRKEFNSAEQSCIGAMTYSSYWANKAMRFAMSHSESCINLINSSSDCHSIILLSLLHTRSFLHYQRACLSCSMFSNASRELLAVKRHIVSACMPRAFPVIWDTNVTVSNEYNPRAMKFTLDQRCTPDTITVEIPPHVNGPLVHLAVHPMRKLDLNIARHQVKSSYIYDSDTKSFYDLSGPLLGFGYHTQQIPSRSMRIGLGTPINI
jgi:hypothetical protein